MGWLAEGIQTLNWFTMSSVSSTSASAILITPRVAKAADNVGCEPPQSPSV
jgi:hypothetical protein